MLTKKKEIQESFRMDVQIGISDMFWFLMHHNYFSFGGILGVAISVGCLIGLILTYQTNDTTTNVFLGAGALVFTVIQPCQLLSKAHRQIVKNPIFHEPMHYEINDKTLEESKRMNIPIYIVSKTLNNELIGDYNPHDALHNDDMKYTDIQGYINDENKRRKNR